MKIGITSDIHEVYMLDSDRQLLDTCDVVCLCGDIFENSLSWYEAKILLEWMAVMVERGKRIVFTPGNHDLGIYRGWLEKNNLPLDEYCRGLNSVMPIRMEEFTSRGIDCLVDEAVNIGGVVFYGAPWSVKFCRWAFMKNETELAQKYENIPVGVDIVLSHTPPLIQNETIDVPLAFGNPDLDRHCGSKSLTKAILEKKPKYVFCGHIHSGDHEPCRFGDTTVVNVSYVDENYMPAYRPYVLEL